MNSQFRYGEEDLAGAKSLVDQCPEDDPDTGKYLVIFCCWFFLKISEPTLSLSLSWSDFLRIIVYSLYICIRPWSKCTNKDRINHTITLKQWDYINKSLMRLGINLACLLYKEGRYSEALAKVKFGLNPK